MRLTVAVHTPTSAAICLAEWRCRRKTSTAAHVAGAVRHGEERGFKESPANFPLPQLNLMRQCGIAARDSKTPRGKFHSMLPPGYCWSEVGKIESDAD
jgi:hypothetical protein